jgi:type II secretory pathway component PulF
LLINLPRILQNIGLEKAYHRLQLRIPAVARWIIKRQINEFFFILALMLEAGVAFADSLPKVVATIKNTCLRERFNTALAALNSGGSVTETLRKVPVINPTALQIINSSEQSGKLASGLLHFTQREAETIALHDEALAEWLPRLVYTVISLWMAYSIIGSQVATVLPGDL